MRSASFDPQSRGARTRPDDCSEGRVPGCEWRRAQVVALRERPSPDRFAALNPLLESVMSPLLTVHQWLYESTDGRIGASLGGRPMLLLRTVGRRMSGHVRITPRLCGRRQAAWASWIALAQCRPKLWRQSFRAL